MSLHLLISITPFTVFCNTQYNLEFHIAIDSCHKFISHQQRSNRLFGHYKTKPV